MKRLKRKREERGRESWKGKVCYMWVRNYGTKLRSVEGIQRKGESEVAKKEEREGSYDV